MPANAERCVDVAATAALKASSTLVSCRRSAEHGERRASIPACARLTSQLPVPCRHKFRSSTIGGLIIIEALVRRAEWQRAEMGIHTNSATGAAMALEEG